jgi:protein-L-isoaspartate(D-aspartate) O-methyltransferase
MTDFATRRTMMVDTQVRPSDVTKFTVIQSMLNTPREAYVPQDKREAAYVDDIIEFGGRVLLDPRTFAKMLDALNPQPNELILDVACGLGYSSAVLAHMSEAVVAVEAQEALANEAQSTLGEQGVHNVAVIAGALEAGAAEHGPYDAIMIQGGIEQMPEAIEAQLKEGGRAIAIFVEGALGVVKLGTKINGVMNWRSVFNAGAPVLEGFERVREFQL